MEILTGDHLIDRRPLLRVNGRYEELPRVAEHYRALSGSALSRRVQTRLHCLVYNGQQAHQCRQGNHCYRLSLVRTAQNWHVWHEWAPSCNSSCLQGPVCIYCLGHVGLQGNELAELLAARASVAGTIMMDRGGITETIYQVCCKKKQEKIKQRGQGWRNWNYIWFQQKEILPGRMGRVYNQGVTGTTTPTPWVYNQRATGTIISCNTCWQDRASMGWLKGQDVASY